MRECLCGCGLLVEKKNRRFRQGHDAKLSSILRRIELGELSEDVIPDVAKNALVQCKCCGKPILPHPSGMGPLCRAGKCKCIKISEFVNKERELLKF